MFVNSHYVYNLEIIHPCRVVYKKHRHKRYEPNFFITVLIQQHVSI